MDLDEDKEKPVTGPVCDLCGKSSNSLYPCFVKRIRRGCAEMVKIYLCAYHFLEQLERDAEEPVPPPPDDDGIDIFELPPPPDEDDEDEDEEEEDEDQDEQNKCNIDHIGQSWG